MPVAQPSIVRPVRLAGAALMTTLLTPTLCLALRHMQWSARSRLDLASAAFGGLRVISPYR